MGILEDKKSSNTTTSQPSRKNSIGKPIQKNSNRFPNILQDNGNVEKVNYKSLVRKFK
jgi:hypothetical protein